MMKYLSRCTLYNYLICSVCILYGILPVDLQSTDAERTVQNPGFVEIAPCPCDISNSLCDSNCCCDNECTEQEKARFEFCIPGLSGGQGGATEDYMCGTKAFSPPDWHVFTCVYWENNAYLGMFYMNKAKIVNEDVFKSDASKYTEDEFSLSARRYVDREFAVIEYAKGVTVTTTRPGVSRGLLALPQQINSGQCNELAPVRFLEPVQSSCRVVLTTQMCSSLNVFSADIYAVSSAINIASRPFQVTSSYNSAQRPSTAIADSEVRYYCANATYISDYMLSSATPLEQLGATSRSVFPNNLQNGNCDEPCSDPTCWQYNTNRDSVSMYDRPLPSQRCNFDDGQTLPPSPSLTAGECQNVVLEVRYSFEWAGQKIQKLIADVVLADAVTVSATAILAQRFSVKWTHKPINQTFSTVDDNFYNSTDPYQRSGIAGYDPLKPLQSGCLQTDPATSEFLSVDTRSEKQMAVFKPGVDGLCVNAQREKLTFGEDVLSSCAVALTFDDLNNTCGDIRQLIQNHLNVLMPSDVIGRFGYNDPSSQAYWISVLRQNLTGVYQAMAATDNNASPIGNETTFPSAGKCHLATAANLHILYAKAGAINFYPRFEIIGAYVNYTFSDWTMACMGSRSGQCSSTSGQTQTFFLHSTVQFVEVPPTPPTPKASFYTKIDPETCESDSCDRFYLYWDEDLCYYDTCWQELAYPLTSVYDGESHEYALAMFLTLVLGIVGYVSVTKPGWK